MDRNPLTSHQVEQLVSLRLLLDDALSGAISPGKYRRGAAIVALDAAVERATAMVAVTRGLKIGATVKLDDLISQVKQDLGDSWKPKVLPDIKHLRRARNASQHEGLEPDREQIPAWASATDAFVSTLIDAEFDVDIHQVVLSDAIKDPGMRGMLKKAEIEYSNGALRSSADCSIKVFRDALNRWKRLRGRQDHMRKPFGREIVDKNTFEYLNRRLENNREFFDASIFSADSAEAVWFVSAVREMGDVLSREDVGRILSFTFEWVVGYESASENWIENRRSRAQIAARLKRSKKVPATIYDCEGVQLNNGKLSATFRISNVPDVDEEYLEWSRALQAALPMRDVEGDWWYVSNSGTVVIEKGLRSAGDFTSELVVLENALVLTHEKLDQVAAELQREKEEKGREIAEFSQMVASISDEFPDWLKDVSFLPSGELVEVGK